MRRKDRHPAMCRLGRARKTTHEEMGEKRCGTARTDETRKWDEESRGDVTKYIIFLLSFT
jgi:hypothetical protein